MLKIRYELANAQRKSSIVMIIVRIQNKRLKISSGVNVNTADFSKVVTYLDKIPDKRKAEYREYERLEYIISELQKARKTIIESYEYLQATKQLTATNLKEFAKSKIAELHGKAKKKQANLLIEYFKKFMKERANIVSKGTLKNYNILYNHLLNYNDKLKFDDITSDFELNFKGYLQDKDISDNTIGKYIKTLKTFMKWGLENEYHSNIAYQKFKYKKTARTQIALTEAELTAIENLNLPNRLEKVRDLFLIQCYTGLRISDLRKLKRADFNGGVLEWVTQKTNETATIPITTKLKNIVGKYNELPTISSQKYNQYIKEICVLAGLNDEIRVFNFKGNKQVSEFKPKYELISSHTARRTFITLLKNKGMTSEQIMFLTGHKKIATLEQYIKADKEQAINKARILLEGLLNN